MIIKYLGILLLVILAGYVLMKLTDTNIKVDTSNKSSINYNGIVEDEMPDKI